MYVCIYTAENVLKFLSAPRKETRNCSSNNFNFYGGKWNKTLRTRYHVAVVGNGIASVGVRLSFASDKGGTI